MVVISRQLLRATRWGDCRSSGWSSFLKQSPTADLGGSRLSAYLLYSCVGESGGRPALMRVRGPLEAVDCGADFSWLNQNRRLSKDYELLPEMSEYMIQSSTILILMLQTISGNTKNILFRNAPWVRLWRANSTEFEKLVVVSYSASTKNSEKLLEWSLQNVI